jgi:hypothetical protein
MTELNHADGVASRVFTRSSFVMFAGITDKTHETSGYGFGLSLYKSTSSLAILEK